MNPFQILLIALRALLRNKMRSFLTTLGVIIGVGAVIAMTAIGAGAQSQVEKSFESMGSNMLMVRSGSSRMGGMRGGAGSQPSITWADLDAIKNEVPSVLYAAPVLSSAAQIMAEGQNWNTSVSGTTNDFFSIRNWDIASGRAFEQNELMSGAKVAIVGQTVVDNLFGPLADPIGAQMRVANIPFEIVGVLKKRGSGGGGQDQDDAIYIPERTFRAKIQGGLGQFVRGMIYVGATSKETTSLAQRQIEELLRERHRIREGADDDFSVRNMADMQEAIQSSTATMTSLLAAIALVSLVVGGIGIMNIMLVSVTERTREIGLRMAIGAKSFDIMTQFLVEAGVLSTIGGFLGIASGIGAASLIGSLLGWPVSVQPDIILIAIGVSAAVGIGFGLWPAFKASRLDPIQALRYE
ncbi:MAG: ABC transporter permease [Myxococcales bacterium]|jgi:putative ABC transport system permease protein|nr:ABC transporter permease [Myxococcales bacterium]